jgi:hypothetical protein
MILRADAVTMIRNAASAATSLDSDTAATDQNAERTAPVGRPGKHRKLTSCSGTASSRRLQVRLPERQYPLQITRFRQAVSPEPHRADIP